MQDIQTETKIFIDGETVIEEEDYVTITSKNGEIVTGEINSINDTMINIDSKAFGDVYVDISEIATIHKMEDKKL